MATVTKCKGARARSLSAKAASFAGAIIAACLASPASAEEGALSPYLKGSAGFMSGYVPPQSGLFVTDTYYYLHGSANAEVRNGNVELGIDTTLNADLLSATYVTDVEIMGGQYAVSGTLDWVWADLSATIDTPLGSIHASPSNNGLGDSPVTPLILGWHDGDFHWSAAMSVYIPTGAYDTSSLSVGKNIWAVIPQFAITYFDPQSGWDVSGTFAYVTQSKNDATDYQSGDLLHVDWALGKKFGAGLAWELGIAGNIMEQVGADRGTGAKLGPFKAQSVGLGPAIGYGAKFGNTPVNFSAKWEHDLDTHNTFRGDIVNVSATVAF